MRLSSRVRVGVEELRGGDAPGVYIRQQLVRGLAGKANHLFSLEGLKMASNTGTKQSSVRVPMSERKAYTCPELAELYSYPASTIYSYVKRGLIPAIRIGGSVRILADDWQRFLDQQRES